MLWFILLSEGNSTTLIAVIKFKKRFETLKAKDVFPKIIVSQRHWTIIFALPVKNCDAQFAMRRRIPVERFVFVSFNVSENLISFPKYIVVVSTTFTALINLAINMAVVIIFALINGVSPSLSWLFVPILILELYLFSKKNFKRHY